MHIAQRIFMQKFIYAATFIALHMSYIQATNIISFFIRPYPHVLDQGQMNERIHRRGMRQKHHLPLPQSVVRPGVGIYALYGGYITLSDRNGQILLPRLETEAQLTLIVTNRLTPILMAGNTIGYWQIPEHQPYAIYHYQQISDPETRSLLWNVSQGEELNDRRIPDTAIIIISPPDSIYIPLGASLTQPYPSLVLPDMYAKKSIDSNASALYLLNLRQFFGSFSVRLRQIPKGYVLVPHL